MNWESPGNLTWKSRGFDCRTSTGLGETGSTLGRHKQNFVHARTREKGAVATQETTEPDSRAGSPQAKQQTGKEHSPTVSRQLDYSFSEHHPVHQSKIQFSPLPVPPIRKLTQASYPHLDDFRVLFWNLHLTSILQHLSRCLPFLAEDMVSLLP